MKLAPFVMIVLIPPSFTRMVSSPTIGLKSTMSRPAGTISGYCTPCPSIGDRPAFFEKYRALERARKDDVSISPGALLPSPPSYGTRSNNTNNDTTDIANLPWSSPSTETIVTAIFRALLTILTLFNVNITWRIHGKSSYPRTPIDSRLTYFYSTQCRPPPPRSSRSFPWSQKTMAGMSQQKAILISRTNHTCNASFEAVLSIDPHAYTLSSQTQSACPSIAMHPWIVRGSLSAKPESPDRTIC